MLPFHTITVSRILVKLKNGTSDLSDDWDVNKLETLYTYDMISGDQLTILGHGITTPN